jgi:hypothetical protein
MSTARMLEDDKIPREFKCRFDDVHKCRSNQYTVQLSRKVISDHFGRNKACTRQIKNWPLFCRKHYQRATYSAVTWQKRKVDLICRQFLVIEETYPQTTYTIGLKKSEMDRLNKFARAVDGGKTVPEAGALDGVKPNPEVKSFQAPIDVLRELQHNLGENKTLREVQMVMSVINQMLDHKEVTQVPSIEFLPELPSDKPVKEKAPRATVIKKPKTTGGRVSKKGAVQKPAAE